MHKSTNVSQLPLLTPNHSLAKTDFQNVNAI